PYPKSIPLSLREIHPYPKSIPLFIFVRVPFIWVMGGSKASSTSEVGNGLPRCGCNGTMKLLVSKSIENPGRKFWKCRNNMNGCGLFLWDDLVNEFAVKETNPSGCRQCEVNK
ncbi:hypothetical protein KIW84_054525, partial [Lathyrus oleraceus]